MDHPEHTAHLDPPALQHHSDGSQYSESLTNSDKFGIACALRKVKFSAAISTNVWLHGCLCPCSTSVYPSFHRQNASLSGSPTSYWKVSAAIVVFLPDLLKKILFWFNFGKRSQIVSRQDAPSLAKSIFSSSNHAFIRKVKRVHEYQPPIDQILTNTVYKCFGHSCTP